jgi:hypothetical protein
MDTADLFELYEKFLRVGVDPMLLMALVIDTKVLHRDTSWGRVVTDLLSGYDLDLVLTAVCKQVSDAMGMILECVMPDYNPFLKWDVHSCLSTVCGRQKDTVVADFDQLVENMHLKTGVVFPLLVQVARVNDNSKGCVQRQFLLYGNILQGLWRCAKRFTDAYDMDHLSILECPLDVQGIRKFYIDWERLLGSMPIGMTADGLRDLALQTPALVCRILQDAGCIERDTTVCVVVKEGTRTVRGVDKVYDDVKVSFHFVFQILVTSVQYMQLWHILSEYMKRHKASEVLTQVITKPKDRIGMREVNAMGRDTCLCGVDFVSMRNPLQGLNTIASKKTPAQLYGSSLLCRLYLRDGLQFDTYTGDASIWGAPKFSMLSHLSPMQAAAAMVDIMITIPGPRCIGIKSGGVLRLTSAGPTCSGVSTSANTSAKPRTTDRGSTCVVSGGFESVYS